MNKDYDFPGKTAEGNAPPFKRLPIDENETVERVAFDMSQRIAGIDEFEQNLALRGVVRKLLEERESEMERLRERLTAISTSIEQLREILQ